MNDKYNKCIENLADEISKWGVGLIVGSGFSKAVISDGDKSARNWKELFEDLTEYLNASDFGDEERPFIDIDEELSNGSTLPQIATKVCKLLAEKRKISYEESKNEIKKIISALVDWVPESDTVGLYKNLFENLNIKWIVTTNYDEVLEAILGEKGYTIDPNQPLTAPSEMIPIYHVHGNRKNYPRLIVTHEDYVPLFKPGNYRESKLFTMMAEAPVLILGYSLSDLNLLSALEQSKQIFKEVDNFPVVLTNFVSDKKDLGYQQEQFDGGKYDQIDINSISDFLKSLDLLIEGKVKKRESLMNQKNMVYEPFREIVEKVENLALNSDSCDDYISFSCNNYFELNKNLESTIWNEIKSDFSRFDKLKELGRPEAEQIVIFNKSLVIIMQYYIGCSHEYNQFQAYSNLLKFILYIIDVFEVDWFTPRGMEQLTESFSYCLRYTGEGYGESWNAKVIWDKEGAKFYKNHRKLWDEMYLRAQIDRNVFLVNNFNRIINKDRDITESLG